ncbi:MAG: 50S ribosomal protein L3 N(5)-glutamine methyltransferase, partial [Gammaproteobacteria bacterium]
MSTAGELIESCARALGGAGLAFGHGTDNAWDEAVALVLGVTELADDRGNLEVPVPADQAARIEALLARRVGERIPLPYLL